MKNLRWLLTGMTVALIASSIITMVNDGYIYMTQFVPEVFISGAAFALWVDVIFKSVK